MLRFLRERTGKWGLYIIFIPIILVFVAWGVETYDNPLGTAAAVVNGETITLTDYRNALQRMIEFYQQMMQGNFDERAQKQFRVREMALQQLIQSHLISEQARNMGIFVTDEAVRKQLLDITFLQKEGKFSKENYTALLNYYRMTAGQFEAGLRKDATIERARQVFEDGVMKTRTEEDKDKQLSAAKLDIEFLKISKDKAAELATVTPTQIKEYLAQESNQKKVKEHYDLHKSEYSKEDQVRARHILIKAQKGNAAEEKAAKEKIAKIQTELATAKFDVLAKKYSEDPGPKASGGDLNYFEKGRMVPEFEAAAFSLDVGKVSAPVQTSYGYHLIQVTDKKPGQSTPFEKASENIAKTLVAQDVVDKKILDYDKQLATDAKAALLGFQGLVKGTNWESTGAFSIADEKVPKLGENEELMTVVFGLSKEKPLSPRATQVGKDIYVLRYKVAGKVAEAPKLDPLGGQAAGRSLFASWSSQLMQKAKISTNDKLFAEEAAN